MILDTKAIKKRCESATEGPWEVVRHGIGWFKIATKLGQDIHLLLKNAKFIAHARTDIPALLDALEAKAKRSRKLKTENTKIRKALEWYADEDNYVGGRPYLVIVKPLEKRTPITSWDPWDPAKEALK